MKLNKNFTLLVTGESIANIGDVLYMVSLISMVFALTGSAGAASVVPFTITSSMFVSSLLTPLLIGRVNLKWLLAGSQIGKTILLVILGVVVAMLTVENYFYVFYVVAGIALLDGVATPIRQTLIPHYVENDHLLRANAIAQTITQMIQMGMWFVGSLFLLIITAQQLIWITGGLFAAASIILCFLQSVSKPTHGSERKLEQIQEGWRTLWKVPVLRRIAMMDVLETIAGTVWIAAILLVFVTDALHAGEKWWGFINGAFFAGLIAGSLYCVKYASQVEKRLGTHILLGTVMSCVVTFLFGFSKLPVLALLFSFAVGLFGQMKSIPQETVIQTSVPKEKLSTVYTSLGALSTGIFGISSLGMGFLADWLGIRFVFMVSGLLLAAVSIIVFVSKRIFERNIA